MVRLGACCLFLGEQRTADALRCGYLYQFGPAFQSPDWFARQESWQMPAVCDTVVERALCHPALVYDLSLCEVEFVESTGNSTKLQTQAGFEW